MSADSTRIARVARRAIAVAALCFVVSHFSRAATTEAADGRLSTDRLRCEYLENPLGIDETSPRLSWLVESDERGQKQTAYHILVSTSDEKLALDEGDLWDSGKVSSDRTTQIVYRGTPLVSRTQCRWKVKVWDADGRPSEWSDPARWSMGLLATDDWKADWISYRDETPLHTSRQELLLPPARHYRKEFAATRPIRRATAYATSLGIYELHVNGSRVGSALFTPGWSDYRKRVYYNTFDVTELLRRGENAVGAVVAEGWYSGYVGFGLLVGYGPNRSGRYFYGKTPALLVQLEIEYADGSRELVATDPTWQVTDQGPVREADIIMGEAHDARRELVGWDLPGCKAEDWQPAIRAEDNGSTKATFFDKGGEREVELGFIRPKRMQAYPGVAVLAIEEIEPVELTEPQQGVYIYNLGQNFSGLVRLNVTGPAGTKVRLRYGEMLHDDGRLMTENLRRARVTDYYTLRGDKAGETWTPRFTYHGFQYVELTGLAAKPDIDAVTGIAVHSDTPLSSSLECSNPVVNQLFSNIVWTQRANFLEVPTDCPQRDERLGWTGDAQIYVRAATYNADVAAFFTKWEHDLVESQRPNGAYPAYAPFPMQHGIRGSAFGSAWMDAGIICPYTIYKVYGDLRIIRRNYASMKRFMDFRRANSPDFRGVFVGNDWGDWLSVGQKTPIELIDAAYFAYTARLMGEMSEAIGRSADAEDYRRLFENVKAAFVKDYVKPDGSLRLETQTAYALAISVDLIPDELREAAGARLAALIDENDGRMATGFLGTRPLLPALTATGNHDLAVRLLESREFPSWGYEVVNGATSIWERWNSYTREEGFMNPSMNSFSHYSFGAVCEWMFQSLAGIDTQGSGFRKVVIRPGPPTPGSNPDREPISWVKARYESIHGPITSNWRSAPDRFELDVTVPANVTATIFLPATDPQDITESGRPLDDVDDVKLIGTEDDRVVLEVGSGAYSFVSN